MEIIAENDKLKADNKTLKKCYKGSKVKVKELQAENNNLINKNIELIKERDRLMKQVSSNSSNSSSTHTHTIKKEIAEYMSHNEGCGGARMFLIPRDEFKNDEYNNTIYWDDGME